MRLGKNYCHKPLRKHCVWIGCLRSLTTGNWHPPMTIGNNAAKRTTPLIQKKAIKWATLLLDNECALERTSVLNCCTSILLGYGAWGLWQLATNTHQQQLVTMLQKGQLPSSKKWVINWATLFLDNKCTSARTTVLNCCASIVFGLGAWGLQQLATNTHQQQSATMLPKGQLPWSKKISYQTRSYLATGQWMHLGKNYCHKPLHKCCAWIGCLRSLTTGNQHPPTPIGNNAAWWTTPLIPKISNWTSYLAPGHQMHLSKNYCLKPLCNPCVWIGCLRSSTIGNQNPPMTISNNTAKRTTPLIQKISNQMSYLAPWQQMCLGKNFCLKLLHKHSAWIWCLWSLTTGNQHPPTPISNNAAKGQLPWSKKISNQTRSYLAPGQWMRLGKNYCHKPLHKCCAWIGCLRSLTTGNQHPPTTIGNNAA